MAKKQARAVRPVQPTGYQRKRFRKVLETKKKVELPPMPSEVARDLELGSRRMLADYLTRNRGIPDPIVALALLKLIRGSSSQAKYQLVMIDHPDGPTDTGGRPKDNQEEANDAALRIARRYNELLAREGKKYLAQEILLKEEGISKSTLRRRLDRAHSIIARQAAQKAAPAWIQRREETLARLRRND